MPATSQGRCVLILSCVCIAASLVACRTQSADSAISIVFKHVPPPDAGGVGAVDTLSGTVRNSEPGARLVIYTHSRGDWFVQPITLRPFTNIGKDGTWSMLTHLGTEYAAVLVKADYHPSNMLSALPPVGGSILFIRVAPGDISSTKPPRLLRFSTYDWTVRELGSDRHGTPHEYSMSNVAVDAKGYLHLRVTKQGSEWTCAEVALPRSLGYGTYDIAVDGLEKLEPATVFDMFTWDQNATDQNRREMNTQLAQWGDPEGKNAEYSVQPYYRPANTYRYSGPNTPLLLTMIWESGRMKFSTAAMYESGRAGGSIAEHTFTADIPAPESESIRLNLCVFDYGKVRQTSDTEVVVKRFRYLP